MNIKERVGGVLRFLGVDRAVGYTLLGRGWSLLCGPINVFMILHFLSGVEQGFYYTFNNILGLQIFFELGLTTVIMQFASHEKSRLHWKDGHLEGDEAARSRLGSLVRSTLKWYGVCAILMVVLVLPAGVWFFSTHQQPGVATAWLLPWCLVVVLSAVALLFTPIAGALEGCGLIEDIVKVQFVQAICNTVLFWSVLWAGGKLLASPAAGAAGLVIMLSYLARQRRGFMHEIVLVRPQSETIDWKREVWPFQWRIALTSLSSYFLFQLFNPVLFAYHGAAAAGQMGMTLSLTQTLATMAMAVFFTKTPQFGGLIAQGDFDTLDTLFAKSLKQSLVLLAAGALAMLSVLLYLYVIQHPFRLRLLPPLPFVLLLLTVFMNQITLAQAAYLRAHKQEPMLPLAIIGAVLMAASTLLLGRPFGALGIVASYCALTAIVGLGGGTYIFLERRQAWRADAELAAQQLAAVRAGAELSTSSTP